VNRTKILLVAGPASFLLFLLALAPARLAESWLASANIESAGLTGTLWQGEARQLVVGRLILSEVHWTLSPLRLLTGRLSADVRLRLVDGSAHGRVVLAPGNRIALRDVALDTSLDTLGYGLGLPLSGGAVIAEIDALRLADGWFTMLVGTVRLAELQLPIPALAGTPPGGFIASFAATRIDEENPLQGTLENLGGPLELNARLTLTPPANYDISGSAQPLAGAPAEIGQALAMLGPRQPDGSYEFMLAGSF